MAAAAFRSRQGAAIALLPAVLPSRSLSTHAHLPIPAPDRQRNPGRCGDRSHRLMLRAGMIRKLAAGLYTWLPLGLRVLRKVERIVREEMDRAGALEVSMPAVQPAELWQESGRWEQYGPELLRCKDRHARLLLRPTHEEIITDLARNEIKSYKQLPVNFYQIQTKFRDEIRPRFGVMRAREFLMKDAYSFHLDEASLRTPTRSCTRPTAASSRRCGLDFRAVQPTPAASAATPRTSSTCSPTPARTPSPSPPQRLRRQRRAGRGRRARRRPGGSERRRPHRRHAQREDHRRPRRRSSASRSSAR
jgi:hypothetical protein